MTTTQIIFTAALVVAVALMRKLDKPDWRLALIFAASLFAGAMNTGNMVALGVGDLVFSLWALFLGTRRGYVTAGLFAAMGGTYALGQLIKLPDYAIYGLVEVLCVCCLGVMINADRWGRGTRRRLAGLFYTFGNVVRRNLPASIGNISASSVQKKAGQ